MVGVTEHGEIFGESTKEQISASMIFLEDMNDFSFFDGKVEDLSFSFFSRFFKNDIFELKFIPMKIAFMHFRYSMRLLFYW